MASEDQDRHSERAVANRVLPPRTWTGWRKFSEWDAEPSDDDPGSDDERATFGRIASLPGIAEGDIATGGSVMEAAYRRQLAGWAENHGQPADSKAKKLVEELNAICRPGGSWHKGDRVIVFTEYKATQQWLAGILTARGLGGEHLGLLFGGMEPKSASI